MFDQKFMSSWPWGYKIVKRLARRRIWAFIPAFLAAALVVLPRATVAATYWQVQAPEVTVIVDGDKDFAQSTAQTALHLRSAARWFFSWPDAYRELPVLIFAVNERLLQKVFQFPPDPPGTFFDETVGHSLWGRTPSLTLVVAPRAYIRGRELRALQYAYGYVLSEAAPSHDWPACSHMGMAVLFSLDEIGPPNHFYVSGERIPEPFSGRVWSSPVQSPQVILTPLDATPKALPVWENDQVGFSCYVLSFMTATAAPADRAALERMLTAVGRGTPLEAATQAELQQSAADFTTRYSNFSASLRMQPDFHQVRVDLPDAISAVPEPTAVEPQKVEQLLRQLCGKLGQCRK